MSRTISTSPLLLIIDDATDLLEAWQLLLENSGFRVVTAASGMAGLNQARRHHPDLIITDYMMPGMDGVTLCRNLRIDPMLASVPIILWTAAIVKLEEAVFDRLLLKPVYIEQLVDEIQTLLPVNPDDTKSGAS